MRLLDEPFIFVSYSSKDEDVVHPEIKRIESQGYRIWYDKDKLQAGHLWSQDICEAINACNCFVVFITRSSKLSSSVEKEMDQALGAEKPMICIYWENIKLPSPFHDIQGVERYRLRTPEYEKQLCRALSEYIKKAEPPPREKYENMGKEPVLASSDMPSGIPPKVIRFILVLVAVFFFLFALMAIAAPYFVAETSSDPLSNRLAAILTGGVFIVIAAGLGLAAFAVHRKYLRRKND